MLKILLGNGGERARTIIKEHKPLFNSKEEFLTFQDGLNSSGDRIAYGEGAATVKL